MESVILVDAYDQEMGTAEKMEAHRNGLLHRAFSVFIFNNKSEMLIHRRALHKYHSGGLWTNACCSHPRPGEDIGDAASRRLQEEMGISAPLEKRFSFIYHAYLDRGMQEYELDHVFTGITDTLPKADPEEISEWKYIPLKTLLEDLRNQPEQYTEWFKIAAPLVIKEIEKYR